MGYIINTPSCTNSDRDIKPQQSFASTKRWLSNAFYQELNRHAETASGDYKTKAQLMIEGIVDMAIDPEKDDYVKLAASKFIIEHLEGKAGVAQEEHKETMPKMVIQIDKVDATIINNNAAINTNPEPKSDIAEKIVSEEMSGEDEE